MSIHFYKSQKPAIPYINLIRNIERGQCSIHNPHFYLSHKFFDRSQKSGTSLISQSISKLFSVYVFVQHLFDHAGY